MNRRSGSINRAALMRAHDFGEKYRREQAEQHRRATVPITTCSRCSKLYDSGSEEQANESDRLCPDCRTVAACPSEVKSYLGDSVYATFDGFGVKLTTENDCPSDPSNTIILEPEVVAALVRFAAVHGITH